MNTIKKSIYFILLFYLINLINAKSDSRIRNFGSNNKYYIISIKDSSEYSFDIQPSKRSENVEKLKKKDLNEVPKFNPLDFDEITEIIKSEDCYSKISDMSLNDTSLCNLGNNSLINNDKIDINQLEKELKPKNKFVSKKLENLAEIIIDNIDTYRNDVVINELQNEVLKRSSTSLKDLLENKIFSKILKKTFNVLDVTLINAYLSKEIYEIVKDLPDVVECIEDVKIQNPTIPESLVHIDKSIKSSRTDRTSKNVKRDENENNYYNITDIKVDTKWSDVSVEHNAGLHLSLISQSKFDSNLIGKYDTNYYYPSTAGSGVDIYIIDGGINVNHADFDTTDRTVTCDAITNEDGYTVIEKDSELSKNCSGTEKKKQLHGISVASAAAGTLYGVAKKANIHAIAIEPYFSNYISALKYIEKYATDPHKTVINISSGGYVYSNTLDKLFNIMIRKGFMVIAASGNEANDACTTDNRYTYMGEVNEKNYPSSFIDVISVGGTDNNLKTKDIPDDADVYNSASFSNYGSCVDIFAPGYCNLASFPDEVEDNKIYTKTSFVHGTSFSSPMVAGVAALLISEHPEIEFNQDILKKMLIDLSIKDIISDLEWLHTPNRFLNIGKTIVYSADNKYKGCGILSGKKSCTDDKCCSASGYCGRKDDFCEVDCQSEYGKCSINNHPSLRDDEEEEEIYKNGYIYNYWMDLCLKFAVDNYVENNIILTVCDNKDTDYFWYVNRNNDGKYIQDTYVDVCMNFDENGIAFANPCETGIVMKDINTSFSKDAIQSDQFPDMCLKPIISDFDPYGITIFSNNNGLRVKMDKCDYDDEYQHWRIRDIPEIIYDEIYDYYDANEEYIKNSEVTITYSNLKEDLPTEVPTNDNNDNNDEEQKDASDVYEEIENTKILTAEPESEVTTTVDSENTEFHNETDSSSISITSKEYPTNSVDVDGEPNFDDIEDNKSYSESYEFEEPEQTTSSSNEIEYNEYGQLFNKDDYIECTVSKIVVTNKKSVWIYNAEKNLCLSFTGKYKQQAILEKCDLKNKGQQWLVPDNNHGYYVNVNVNDDDEDEDICIIYTQNKDLILNKCVEEISLEKLYVKNHASVIEYKDDTLTIYDELHDEEVCLNIQEKQEKKNEVLLNMVPCDQPHSKFILTTEFPNAK
ncbi:subtilisin-like protein [Neocallimastix californiae]|uniref:Subtilisin-like protein n=1 Tax=Neocallimastix californiae TaxID=1754190 RepID=A0A1Y2CXW0_9FUNG|nr:subtilisin-like protein [Neocallimastix californiae]|eukprot:ORY51726.1 subtilisin-like protein [Neocallimastix californiae]